MADSTGNGVTLRQVLSVVGMLLLGFVGTWAGVIWQSKGTQESAIYLLREDMRLLLSWKTDVDKALGTLPSLDKARDLIIYQQGEVYKVVNDLLKEMKGQQAELDRQSVQSIRFQAQLDRIEAQTRKR